MIDDDEDLRDALVEQLSIIEEFEVLEAGTAQGAIEITKENDFDLLILDIGLPDADGRELFKLLRKQGVKCPIIMLTGQNSDADTILGLDAGANDYVTKPFKFPVLLARMRAQLRQHEQSEDANFVVGPYTFKPAHKVLLMQYGQ